MRQDTLIHIIFGSLPEDASRGGASILASDPTWSDLCLLHPKAGGVPPERDWHVIYDPKLRERFEKETRIPNPIEPILQHEIIGHILPVLRDPKLLQVLKKNQQLREENERNALEAENRYRRHVGLPEVPPDLQDPAKP